MANGNRITEHCCYGQGRHTGAFSRAGDNVSATCRRVGSAGQTSGGTTTEYRRDGEGRTGGIHGFLIEVPGREGFAP
ncbi:fucose-binding lectin protein [Burkholderia cepacia]|uniref:fucose-binding lectin protein n=1 Tax=Burkholderia cepacia TaxID=292 RepID=UPI001FC7DB1B|nr:fucose-binding lectin protein [Burkholderia cepacia]